MCSHIHSCKVHVMLQDRLDVYKCTHSLCVCTQAPPRWYTQSAILGIVSADADTCGRRKGLHSPSTTAPRLDKSRCYKKREESRVSVNSAIRMRACRACSLCLTHTHTLQLYMLHTCNTTTNLDSLPLEISPYPRQFYCDHLLE